MPDDLTEDERIIWLTVYATRLERYLWETPPGSDSHVMQVHDYAEETANRVIACRREAAEESDE